LFFFSDFLVYTDIEKFKEDDFIRTVFELIVAEQLIDFDILDSQGNPYFFILVFSENNILLNYFLKQGQI